MEYEISQTSVSNDNKLLYSKLLSFVFPDTAKFTPEYINWQYDLNPAGKIVGFDAFYNNELAAHYVTMPVMYQYNEKLIKGLVSLNTATHPDHTGKGLFTKLAQRTYEEAKAQGYKFVIGVANQNSTPGFIKKLGFNLVSTLDVNVFFGNINSYSPDLRFFQSYWDENTIQWRIKNPSSNYIKCKNGIFSKTHISFIKALLTQKTKFNSVFSNEKIFSPLKMSIGLNNKKNGLFNINLPDKYKPSPLNLIFKPLEDLPFEINKSNICFESIDFDAY